MNGENYHQELLALLKNAHDDIERAKQRGQRDFYYVLFAIGAVIGLYRAVFDQLEFQWIHHLFFIAPPILMVVGFWLVWATQRTLEQQRKLVVAYQKNLNEKIQEILNGPLGESVNQKLYPRLFVAVIAIATIFSVIIMVGLMLSQS